eukprot:6095220-Prymnesium_polylepis.3
MQCGTQTLDNVALAVAIRKTKLRSREQVVCHTVDLVVLAQCLIHSYERRPRLRYVARRYGAKRGQQHSKSDLSHKWSRDLQRLAVVSCRERQTRDRCRLPSL